MTDTIHETTSDEAAEMRRRTDSLWWMRFAGCRDADPDLFITGGDGDDEPYYPPATAKRYCDSCPVRTECLDYGQQTDLVGVWGGLTRYQRNQIGRDRSRTVCPGCGSREVISEGNSEICVACAISWTAF